MSKESEAFEAYRAEQAKYMASLVTGNDIKYLIVDRGQVRGQTNSGKDFNISLVTILEMTRCFIFNKNQMAFLPWLEVNWEETEEVYENIRPGYRAPGSLKEK